MRTSHLRKMLVNRIWRISASQKTGMAKPRKLKVVAA
jgi:hypothetical protein